MTTDYDIDPEETLDEEERRKLVALVTAKVMACEGVRPMDASNVALAVAELVTKATETLFAHARMRIVNASEAMRDREVKCERAEKRNEEYQRQQNEDEERLRERERHLEELVEDRTQALTENIEWLQERLWSMEDAMKLMKQGLPTGGNTAYNTTYSTWHNKDSTGTF